MTRVGFWTVLAAFAALLACPSDARSHPHVWVTVETEILTDAQKKISGLRHHWTFDEFFSSFAVQGLDKNGDGAFDRAELGELAKINITSLKEYDFFTFAKADDADIALREPTDDYFLEYKNGLLTLHFTLPVDKPADPRGASIRYSVYDPSFYIDFSYKSGQPVRLAKQAPAGCRAELAAPIEKAEAVALSEAFYQGLGTASDFGKQFARDVVIACEN